MSFGRVRFLCLVFDVDFIWKAWWEVFRVSLRIVGSYLWFACGMDELSWCTIVAQDEQMWRWWRVATPAAGVAVSCRSVHVVVVMVGSCCSRGCRGRGPSFRGVTFGGESVRRAVDVVERAGMAWQWR